MQADGVNTDPALDNHHSQVPQAPMPKVDTSDNPIPRPDQPLALRTDYFNAHPDQNYFPTDHTPAANVPARPVPPAVGVQRPKVITPKALPAKAVSAANDPIIPKHISTAVSNMAHDAEQMLKAEWHQMHDDVVHAAHAVEKTAVHAWQHPAEYAVKAAAIALAQQYGLGYDASTLSVKTIDNFGSGVADGATSAFTGAVHGVEHLGHDIYQGAKVTFTHPSQALTNFENNTASMRQGLINFGGQVVGEVVQGAKLTWNHPAQAFHNVETNVTAVAHQVGDGLGKGVNYLQNMNAHQFGELVGEGVVFAGPAIVTGGAALAVDVAGGLVFGTEVAGVGAEVAGLGAEVAGLGAATAENAVTAAIESSAGGMVAGAGLLSRGAGVLEGAAVGSSEVAAVADAAGAEAELGAGTEVNAAARNGFFGGSRAGAGNFPGIKASNQINRLKLSTELKLKEAGIIDSQGMLTNEALKNSFPAMRKGSVLKNPTVVDELTKDGSKITDWEKKKIQSVELSSGQKVEVHFYQNKFTDEVNYIHHDFKVKNPVDVFHRVDSPMSILDKYGPKF